MVIYLDESYDNKRTWLLISALFNPKSSHRKFYKEIRKLLIRNKHTLLDGSLKEIKYNNCLSKKMRLLYQEAIDIFMSSDSYFASVPIKTDDSFDLERYGTANEPAKIKRERAYRTLAEHLLYNELRDATNAVLFLDKMTRCEPKQFLSILKQNFCVVGSGYSQNLDRPLIRHIQDVVSSAEGYELMGICDLLQGCILNNITSTTEHKGKSSHNKNLLREYLVKKIGVPDLTLTSWVNDTSKLTKEIKDKFNIRYVVQADKK